MSEKEPCVDHVDGDWPTKAPCKYHYWPSCHPAQVGPENRYGCLHPAWPCNRQDEFCPIVECGGEPGKCEIPTKLLRRAIGAIRSGMTRRTTAYERRQAKAQVGIDACEELLKARE